MDGPGLESQRGAIFSAPVQTGPGAHLASYTMGSGSLPGVKRPQRGVDRVNFTFTLPLMSVNLWDPKE